MRDNDECRGIGHLYFLVGFSFVKNGNKIRFGTNTVNSLKHLTICHVLYYLGEPIHVFFIILASPFMCFFIIWASTFTCFCIHVFSKDLLSKLTDMLGTSTVPTTQQVLLPNRPTYLSGIHQR